MHDLVGIAAAYALGGVCSGYYIVRYLRGIDVRTVGSGSAGGTNAAFVLGYWAKPVVGGLDGLKGAVAVAVAQRAGLDAAGVAAVVFAVVLGHVFPAQLGFRGGKGVGTSLGALAVYSPFSAVAVLAIIAVLFFLSKRLQISGLAAYTLAALAVPLWQPTAAAWAAVAATSALVIYANRVNFLEEIRLVVAEMRDED